MIWARLFALLYGTTAAIVFLYGVYATLRGAPVGWPLFRGQHGLRGAVIAFASIVAFDVLVGAVWPIGLPIARWMYREARAARKADAENEARAHVATAYAWRSSRCAPPPVQVRRPGLRSPYADRWN